MCCLFGIIDYGHSLNPYQKTKMLSVLAAACEVRGTDATGIAYNSGGKLRIYKRPTAAHKLHFHIPADGHVIMGHTRMTTQGSEKRNYNNHPFPGVSGVTPFALAHNGVLCNDVMLRRSERLPKTKVETDSYIAVQLLEQSKDLNFAALRTMSEQVEGSFCFTVLDAHNRLFLIKGDNPLCVYHYPRKGLYLYASTEEILKTALRKLGLLGSGEVSVPLSCGDLLCIDGNSGRLEREQFDFPLYSYGSWFCGRSFQQGNSVRQMDFEEAYWEELKSVAGAFGYGPEDIDFLHHQGFTTDELEELLYCGEL
ncbi:MAG: hypothetical protein PHX61_09845 [Alphaproteobacteria bacterium]|nr:hypothetical protein [Alphaproteobacteria bacterium]